MREVVAQRPVDDQHHRYTLRVKELPVGAGVLPVVGLGGDERLEGEALLEVGHPPHGQADVDDEYDDHRALACGRHQNGSVLRCSSYVFCNL